MSADPNDLASTGQSFIPAIGGSPEGRFKAPPGFLIVDEIACELYQKTTSVELDTGWRVQRGVGTLPFAWTFGAGDPNGSVAGVIGDHYTQINGTQVDEWVKTSNVGSIGWV